MRSKFLNKLNSLLSFSCALTACPSFAAGIITLEGQIYSMTRDKVVLLTQGSLVTIRRSSLNREDAKKVETPSQKLSLALPLESIQDIKAAPPSSKN